MSSVFFTEEENKFREEVREFARKEIEPIAQDIEKKMDMTSSGGLSRSLEHVVSSGFYTQRMLEDPLGE